MRSPALPLALLLAACGPSATAVREPDPPPPAIEIAFRSAPLETGKRYSVGANFIAAAPGGPDAAPIAQSRNLEFGSYDLNTLGAGRVPQTPETRAALEELAQRLEAHGWHRAGSAGPWYAYRFTR